MFAARSVGTGWTSVVASMAAMAVVAMAAVAGARADAPAMAAPCAAGQLRAAYTVVPFSQGDGNVSYVLTVRNRSAQACALTQPLSMQLLDRGGRPAVTRILATDAAGQVVLAPGQWAQAESRFSPDIAGPGEIPSECEPPAHALALGIGGDRVLAPMDPSPVCENGTISFGRLIAVAPTPACDAASLNASFDQASPAYQGATAYYLELTNVGDEQCHTRNFVSLTLLDAGGGPLPTREFVGIQSPYLIPSGSAAYAVATLRTSAGPGEPLRGPCEPLATQVRVAPSRSGAAMTVPIEPAMHACHGGAIALSGLYPGP